MPAVDISAQHSKAEKPFFGLDRIAQELIEHPLREHIIIFRAVRSGLTVNDTRGTETPRIRPLHIEVIVDPGRRKEAEALLDAEYRSRTGRESMPPTDLFNLRAAEAEGSKELDGQTTVDDHLAEAGPATEPDAATDPTSGPHFSNGDDGELWPGDAGYEDKK